jgi:hypothetical protein
MNDGPADVHFGVRLTRPMRERLEAVALHAEQTPSALVRQGLALVLAMHEEKTK